VAAGLAHTIYESISPQLLLFLELESLKGPILNVRQYISHIVDPEKTAIAIKETADIVGTPMICCLAIAGVAAVTAIALCDAKDIL